MRQPKTPIPENIRQAVFARDNYTCRYCGNKQGPFSPDHVYPESRGGVTSVENLVTACRECNSKKHAKIGMWPKPIGYFDIPKPYINTTLYFGITDLIISAFINPKSGLEFYAVFGIGVVLSLVGFMMTVFGIKPKIEIEVDEDEINQ